jgi:hypothetical protein
MTDKLDPQSHLSLRKFIANYAADTDVDGMLRAIESAICRFVGYDSKIEVRGQSEILSKAVESYRKALETPESKSIWPWLLSGKSGPRSWASALSDARKIEAAVKEIADNLATGKREPDDLRFSLAYELASYFEIATGSAPTFSNNEDAKTKRPAFEQFVALALTESQYFADKKVRQLLDSIRSFVRDAVNHYKVGFAGLVRKQATRKAHFAPYNQRSSITRSMTSDV